jgi:hypothetical protein
MDQQRFHQVILDFGKYVMHLFRHLQLVGILDKGLVGRQVQLVESSSTNHALIGLVILKILWFMAKLV